MAYSFHNQNMSTLSNVLVIQPLPLKTNLLLSTTIKKGS